MFVHEQSEQPSLRLALEVRPFFLLCVPLCAVKELTCVKLGSVHM